MHSDRRLTKDILDDTTDAFSAREVSIDVSQLYEKKLSDHAKKVKRRENQEVA
jgi:hypothetical protein